MKFRKRGDRLIVFQHFEKEKIFMTKHGKKFNIYDSIQAANVDTNIYEVMNKYHCMPDEAQAIMEQKGGIKGVFGEFLELQNKLQNLADIQKIKEKAENMFNALPLDIREKYGHNLENFLKDAKNFQQQEQKKINKQEEKEVIKNELKQ